MEREEIQHIKIMTGAVRRAITFDWLIFTWNISRYGDTHQRFSAVAPWKLFIPFREEADVKSGAA